MANKNITQLDAITLRDSLIFHAVDTSLGTDPKDRKVAATDMASSTTAKGFIETATTAEAQAGLADNLAVTPAGVAAYMAQTPLSFGTDAQINKVRLYAVGVGDWWNVSSQQTFQSQPDEVLYFGYNVVGPGQFGIPATQALYMGFEADYYSTPTTHFSEWYIEYYAPNQTTNLRPIAAAVNIGANTVAISLTGAISMFSSAGDQNIVFTENGSIGLATSAGVIQKTTNNVGFISQMNAAGNALIQLLWLDSLNWIEMGATVFVTGDVRHSNTAYGPIIKDRATGSDMRIISTNGTLSTEAA